MPKRLIPIPSDEQMLQLADLRGRAGAILKLAHGISASARALLSAAFLSALLLSYTSSALAQGNFVYINNNVFGGPNSVSAFSVGADCSLTPIPGSPFLTGGLAAAAGAGSANQAEVCGNNLYLRAQRRKPARIGRREMRSAPGLIKGLALPPALLEKPVCWSG